MISSVQPGGIEMSAATSWQHTAITITSLATVPAGIDIDSDTEPVATADEPRIPAAN
ncbi:MAG: hypothetical protein MZV63_15595 [Marinilabiliales bacterium]|nr:hypothetical protein [Marinilabiliales bacterium]